MVAAADTQGWAYPYWNILQLDAALNGLANAARTGAAPLVAPAVAPGLNLVESGGTLPGGQTIEVVQTFVDEWGRETVAGAQGSQSTGTGITNPAVAPTPGTPSSEATGYGGGTLIIVFTWVDASGGETLASPAATVELPYLSGLYSQLEITLPSTPAAAGAAQAWVYVQHRAGNVVLAKKITDPDQNTVTLDGNTADCYLTPPYVNTTSSVKSIEITGQTDAAAEKTRFYVRRIGEEWTAGDHRLTAGGLDEWDIATVSYPIVCTGTNVVPGYPPTVSQVKAIRPIDLETETSGTLDDSHLPDTAVLEAKLVRSLGESLMSGCEVTAHAPADMGVNVGTGEVLLEAGRFVYEEDSDLVIPLADPGNPRIDIICIADDGAIEGPTENAALKGTPAAEPVVPSTPAGYIKLAEVTVGAAETEIDALDIEDARWLVPTLVAAVLEFRDADEVIADDLQDHIDDADAHSSHAVAKDTVNQACPNSVSTDFTMTDMENALITEVLAVATTGGAIDYDLYFYSDSGRTVLEYQAGEGSGAGIQVATFRDRIPFEWFGGTTIYARVTNYSLADISNLALTIKYRK